MNRRHFLKTTSAAALATTLSPAFGQERKTVTLAFVGVGHIHTPGFIRVLKQREDARVKSVWDHDTARAEKRAKELNAAVVANVNDIWSDPEINAVVVCSETNRHHELVLAGAKARKHMFVEKPLGITGKESLEMADAIERAGLIFNTGYFTRADPKYLFVREQLAKGNLGRITRIRGSNCHSGSLGGWFDTEWRWMADPKVAGVGAFGDLGTHLLDILMWLMGDVEAVTGDIKTVTGRYGDCDESGEALIKFKNGVTGTLAAGWVDVDDPVPFLVSGTEGHIAVMQGRLYFKSNKVEDADGKQSWTELPPAPVVPINQFVNAVAGQSDQPLVPVRQAAQRVVVMEAIYQAARERKWVNLA